jgi:hypothetical protein
MTEKDYLPQYAAELVHDLKLQAEYGKSIVRITEDERKLQHTCERFAEFIRLATHIVLPPNGEIYRENDTLPTPQECQSIVALPNFFTTFEFKLTNDYFKNLAGRESPNAFLLLAIDYKQIEQFDNEKFEGNKEDKSRTPMCLTLFTRYEPGAHKPIPNARWNISQYNTTYLTPLEIHRRDGKKWATEIAIAETYNGVRVTADKDPELISSITTVYSGCLNMVLQACHALNVGATLEARKEKSYTRNRTFEKKGVGGFEYHVLKLPHGTVKETLGSRQGDRDGPRYHFRRAHLRNLSSGAQTFVRSCFVGNREKGEVVKNYQMETMSQ